MFRRRFYRGIIWGVFILALFIVRAFSQDKPEKPTANMNIEKLVSMDLAEKIAKNEHYKKRGKGVRGKTTVAYNLDESVIAYIVPYKIGEDSFPSDEEIMQEILEARLQLVEAKKELAKIREECLAKGNVEMIEEGERARIVKPQDWLQAEEKVQELRNKCWGIGRYATLIISATKNLAPILQGSNGLPAYYTWRMAAEEKAKEALNTPSVHLTKVFFNPPMDQMFEFEANGKKVWVRLFPLRVYSPGEVKKVERAKALAKEEVQQALKNEEAFVKKKWEEVLREVQNEK